MSGRQVVVELVPDDEVVRETLARGWAAGSHRDAPWVGIAIDVLRATSTLTVARANGAAAIVPFADPAAALAYRSTTPGSLACGEREGRIVAGFDLGNSPSEYTRERVGGRTLAFASTNGSRALLELHGCGRRWLGAFVNASAVVRACAESPLVWITCAGKLGEPAAEDTACAGWIAARLAERGHALGSEDARRAAAAAPRDAAEIRARVEGSAHATYLASLGPEFSRDVAFCATLDSIGDAFEF